MEENIKKLEFKEHIRKRPAMYLGSSGSKGIINLIKGLILDANNELKTENNFFQFSIHNKNEFQLHIKSVNDVEQCFSKLKDQSGCFPKYHLQALEALSSRFEVERIDRYQANICWSLDETVFKNTTIDYIHLCEVLAQVAYLNRETEILITDKTKKHLNQTYYSFPEGIKYIYERCKIEALGKPQFELSFDNKIDNIHFQVLLGYRTDWYPSPIVMSFANEIHTTCGGSLVDGIMEGLRLGCREFVKKSSIKSYKIKKEKFNNGLILICSVKGDEFKYGGSFKESLIDDDIKKKSKKLIKRLTLEFMANNKEKTDKFLWRFDESQLTSGIM